MKKAHKISLIIGLIIIAATTVIILTTQFLNASQLYKNTIQDPNHNKYEFWFWVIFEIILIKSIIIFSEISIVKNIYTLLKTKQLKYRKILCIVSSVLAILSFVLLHISETPEYYRNIDIITREDAFYMAWVSVIISFILGSIKIKNRKTQKNPSVK